MDTENILSQVINLTAHLESIEGENFSRLEQLRTDLSVALSTPSPIGLFGNLEVARFRSLDDFPLPLVDELRMIIQSSQLSETIPLSKLMFIQREAPDNIAISDGTMPEWAKNQKPNYTLGPFKDTTGKLIWYDFFKQYRSVYLRFKGDNIPFVKISIENDELPITIFNTLPNKEITIPKCTVWIRSQYFNGTTPANSFVGIRVVSGKIVFGQNPANIGGNITLNDNDICKITLKLEKPESTAVGQSSISGKDARDAKANLPDEISFTIKLKNISDINIGNSKLKIFNNEYRCNYDGDTTIYEKGLSMLLFPLSIPNQNFGLNISEEQVSSSLIRLKGDAEVETMHWAIPLTLGDFSDLGEAAGNGGFLLNLTAGLSLHLKNLKNNPLVLRKLQWLIAPNTYTIYVVQAKTLGCSQQYGLWEEANEGKQSSISINFGPASAIRIYCLGDAQYEAIITEVAVKAHLDRPVTTDMKRLNIDHEGVQYVLGQQSGADFIQLTCADVLKKRFQQKRFDDLKPISVALSNAFAKVSPIDGFLLRGETDDGKNLKSGNFFCIFRLYSLLPIFSDPYTTNTQLKSVRSAPWLSRNFPVNFPNHLVANVKWIAPSLPVLTLNLEIKQDSLLFDKVEKKRKSSIERLKGLQKIQQAYSEAPAESENIITIDHNKILQEDEMNIKNQKNNFRDFKDAISPPDVFILDVSGNADHIGIGVSGKIDDQGRFQKRFQIKGVDLVASADTQRIFTLPHIQWEAIETIENENVQPKNFPSPAIFPDSGDPTLLATKSYRLVPVSPKPVIEELINHYYNAEEPDHEVAALFSLPFGMNAFASLSRPREQEDFGGDTSEFVDGVNISLNQPSFNLSLLKGATQIKISAFAFFNDPNKETPGLRGSTIQLRNLIDKKSDFYTGLSVLGPLVDTTFNSELQPGGANPRVPLARMDLSGYGASIFSEWKYPEEKPTVSQVIFNVINGRTSYEVVQIRNPLFCCGARLIRTITIRRTSGGGVTREDSGWQAETDGLFDFSWTKDPEYKGIFHKGLVLGHYNINNIRDGKIVNIPAIGIDGAAKLQEVIYDADVKIDDVSKGGANGFIPCKGLRGYVQLTSKATLAKPDDTLISPAQLQWLIKTEGAIGGSADCVLNIGDSGQEMRTVRTDTTFLYGKNEFANVMRGSLILPKEGAWSVVRSIKDQINQLDSNMGLPLVRYNNTANIYRFTEPSEDEKDEFGLMHSSSSHRTLFLKPTIKKNEKQILTRQPLFADVFLLINSTSLFPEMNDVFSIGVGIGKLEIISSGVLELVSSGKINIYNKQRLLSSDASLSTSVLFQNDTLGEIKIKPFIEPAWEVNINYLQIIHEIPYTGEIIMRYLFNFISSSGLKPVFIKTDIKFDSFLSQINDFFGFLNSNLHDTDLGDMDIDFSNSNNLSNIDLKLKFGLAVGIEYNIKKEYPHFFLKIIFDKKGKKGVTLLGVPPLLPPFNKSKGKIKIGIFYGNIIKDKKDEKSGRSFKSREPALGFSAKLSFEVAIKSFTFTNADAGYVVGFSEFKFVTKVSENIMSYKFGSGSEGEINLLQLGRIKVNRLYGIEYVTSSLPENRNKIFAFISINGELGIASVVVGITVEGKAPVSTILEGIEDIVDGENIKSTLNKVISEFELTLVLEVSIAFVINLEEEFTFKMPVQLL